MSFLGKLFGSEPALEAVVGSVRDGLDVLVYTDEEKAQAASSDRSEARAMVVQWMASTQGQNLARRLIALVITSTWLGMYLLSVACGMAVVFIDDEHTSLKVYEVGNIAKVSAMDMNPAVMLILAFYFAAPHMGDIAKAVSGKFTQSLNKG